jgi:hypothetical protein
MGLFLWFVNNSRGDVMTKERKVRIRWDRIGSSLLAGLLLIAEFISGNYPALMWCGVATLFMVLLFREQDRCLNAMETAVKIAMVLNAVTNNGDDDGDDTTQS